MLLLLNLASNTAVMLNTLNPLMHRFHNKEDRKITKLIAVSRKMLSEAVFSLQTAEASISSSGF